MIGVFGTVLQSKLRSVEVNLLTLAPTVLKCGDQESHVPVLLTLCTTPLGSLLHDSSLHYHFYAEDIQLYSSFSQYLV